MEFEYFEVLRMSSDCLASSGRDVALIASPHQVVTWQKDIVAMTLAAGKPVVVATQMLETMQKNPRPTRAEVADVTNAALSSSKVSSASPSMQVLTTAPSPPHR